VFTARYGLILYIKRITFSLEKANLLVHKRGDSGGICSIIFSNERASYIGLNLVQFLLVFNLNKTKYFKFYCEFWLHKSG
jgi:hypothetical protein